MPFIAFILLATLAIGCAASLVPTKGIVDFVTSSPDLEKAILDAAQEWTDQGVVIAAQITVNVNPKGLPIQFLTSEELIQKCGSVKRGDQILSPDGCTHGNSSGQSDAIYIKRGLDPARIRLTLLHELIHMIVPISDHLPDGEIGIMSKRANSSVITPADLNFISAHTRVIENV